MIQVRVLYNNVLFCDLILVEELYADSLILMKKSTITDETFIVASFRPIHKQVTAVLKADGINVPVRSSLIPYKNLRPGASCTRSEVSQNSGQSQAK
jgi:hypothetical protein